MNTENAENIGTLYFITLNHIFLREYAFKNMHDSGPVQIFIHVIVHVLCVAPGYKHN